MEQKDLDEGSPSSAPSVDRPIRNYRSPEGAQIGQRLAQWCDDAEPKARLRMPELPPRCNSCAFRAGPHLANGSPATQMDALKCVMEGREFYCHEPAREDALCSGWAMFMLAADGPDDFKKVPWDFVGGTERLPQSGCVNDRTTFNTDPSHAVPTEES